MWNSATPKHFVISESVEARYWKDEEVAVTSVDCRDEVFLTRDDLIAIINIYNKLYKHPIKIG
jgi:hypothetical protein